MMTLHHTSKLRTNDNDAMEGMCNDTTDERNLKLLWQFRMGSGFSFQLLVCNLHIAIWLAQYEEIKNI